MIRLVSQFDRPDYRAALATPSCACACCCCCCCLAASVATASFTAFNLRAAARQQGVSPMRRETVTHLGWLVFPAAPIAVGLAIAVASRVLISDLWSVIALPAIVAVLAAGLSILYWKAGQRRPVLVAILTVVIGVALFFLEGLFGFVFVILAGGMGGLVVFLIVDLGLAAGGFAVGRHLARSRRPTAVPAPPPS